MQPPAPEPEPRSPRGAAPSWPAGCAVYQQEGSSELLLTSSPPIDDGSGAAGGKGLLSLSDTWDSFFEAIGEAEAEAEAGGASKHGGGGGFEWYYSCDVLWPLMARYFRPGLRLLHIGCGTSTLGTDCYDLVLREHGKPLASVANVDQSAHAIKQLDAGPSRPNIVNMAMDATQMSFGDGRFDICVDKGTFDAVGILLPSEAQRQGHAAAAALLREAARVVAPCGWYLLFSTGRAPTLPLIVDELCREAWDRLELRRVPPPEGGGSSSPDPDDAPRLPVYLFALRRAGGAAGRGGAALSVIVHGGRGRDKRRRWRLPLDAEPPSPAEAKAAGGPKGGLAGRRGALSLLEWLENGFLDL